MPVPGLNAAMACDTAFRVIAQRYLAELNANHEATCNGDPTALHQMRIALTHLRTAIRFFSPMVDDPSRAPISDGLKWLNTRLGAVRDLDVAIERIKTVSNKQPQVVAAYRSWSERRDDGHRLLAQVLRSARYRRLIERTSGWIENGPWLTKKGKQAAKARAAPIAAYGAARLVRWEGTLLKKSRKLRAMDTRKRHRLRLLNKRLSYSIEALEDIFSDKRFSKQQAALKHLRKAQRSLGQLNDDERGHVLAAALERDGVRTPLQFIGPKREKRLLQTTAEAYRKLTVLKK